MMRWYMKALKMVLACGLLLSFNTAFAMNGQTLLDRCKADSDKYNKGFCFGFVTSTVAFVNFCPPQKNTLGEDVITFIKYGDANPTQMTNDASLVVEISLIERWPCANNKP